MIRRRSLLKGLLLAPVLPRTTRTFGAIFDISQFVHTICRQEQGGSGQSYRSLSLLSHIGISPTMSAAVMPATRTVPRPIS